MATGLAFPPSADCEKTVAEEDFQKKKSKNAKIPVLGHGEIPPTTRYSRAPHHAAGN